MSEDQERLAGVVLGGVLVAAMLVLTAGAYRLMRDMRDDHRGFIKAMTERVDHSMWAAEVDAARDAPGES